MRPRWWAYVALGTTYTSTIVFVQLRQSGSPLAIPAGVVLVVGCLAIAAEAIQVSRTGGNR